MTCAQAQNPAINEGAIVPLRLPSSPLWAVYALAHAGKTLFWVVSDLYFTWIVMAVGGLQAGVAGLGLGLSILLAAGADYLGGRWLGRSIATARDAGRMQARACIATGLALVLFAAVGFYGGAYLVTLMMAALVLFRLTYAALDITQNALPALIARDDAQRATYAMWRNIAGGGVRIALSAGFVPLMLQSAPGHRALRFLLLAIGIAVGATLVSAALQARLASSTQPPAIPLAPGASGTPFHLIAAMGLASLGMTVFQQLEPFFVARALASTTGTLFMTACALGAVVCQPAWRALMPDRRTRWAIAAACLLSAALMLVPPPYGLPWALLAGLAYGSSAGGALLWLWSAISHGRPAQAIARISRFSASAKLGQALGLVVAGRLLQGQMALPLAMALTLVLITGALLLASTPNPPDRDRL